MSPFKNEIWLAKLLEASKQKSILKQKKVYLTFDLNFTFDLIIISYLYISI